jgi:DNA-binding NtrC family response regulator
VILADSTIRPEHLGINIKLDFAALEEASRTLPQIASEAAKQAEIAAIQKVMEYTGGNKSKAAIILGVSYKTLLNKVKEYQLGPVDDVASENEVSEEIDHAR